MNRYDRAVMIGVTIALILTLSFSLIVPAFVTGPSHPTLTLVVRIAFLPATIIWKLIESVAPGVGSTSFWDLALTSMLFNAFIGALAGIVVAKVKAMR